ncbi:flavin reductase family protein [Nocardioides sp.]|uniref:flavin reductase family protein n=1 Tax=Nocardioides sp. TaxID=35761 RepID=UPI002631E6CA|nr:flavin reductase family protein [Nocardioides sp.]
MARHFYEPARGHGLAHDPFNAIVGPRPIGWISTVSGSGVRNLAPYSFFNAFNYTPPIVGFASLGHKDSVTNIEATEEFCWNLVSRPLAEQMNTTSAMVDSAVDEFDLAALTAGASTVVGAPHVAEAGVVFECRRSQILQLTSADGVATDTWLVLGEVVGVHIDSALLVDGSYSTVAGEPVLRGGGPADYYTIGAEQLFRMHRPQV